MIFNVIVLGCSVIGILTSFTLICGLYTVSISNNDHISVLDRLYLVLNAFFFKRNKEKNVGIHIKTPTNVLHKSVDIGFAALLATDLSSVDYANW